MLIIKPDCCDGESCLRSFPNEQDEISCINGMGNLRDRLYWGYKFMSGKHLVHAESLPLITQRTNSGMYQ